jgi:tetratricopeptide (TPR) repeat protein
VANDDIKGRYRDIPEEDQKKARDFFDRGRAVADTGNYEYAIEMFLQGLTIDPDSKEAHQQLWEIGFKRKAMGGKDLGMMQKMSLKRPSKDDKQNMLNAEKLLAYNPGDTDAMESLLTNAHRGGYYDTVLWIGAIFLKANAESKSPSLKKFLVLKDVYKDIGQWKLATQACHYALKMNPDDMDLQSELKNLGAQDTMTKGNYLAGGSFRDSMRDKEGQDRLLDADKDVHDADMMLKQIQEAEASYKADPVEGKLFRLIDFLEKTEDPEHENRAIELLESAYERTKQFRFRQRLGKIKMSQLNRMERSMRQALQANTSDESLRKDYEQFKTEQLEFELNEYTLWADAYPSDLTLRFHAAARMFALRRYDEAIPLLQQARQDPKIKTDATVTLGRAFLETGFVDEAIETLQGVIDEYELKGDDRSKLMNYWQGRALEEKGLFDQAIKRYSQVAQWEFKYKDVQQRIKNLRSPTRQ